MNERELLQVRLDRLEKEIRRWRWGLGLVCMLLGASIVGPAHAAERFLSLVGLTADSVNAGELQARTVDATEVVAQRIWIKDSAGKIYGTFGLGIANEVSLELRTPDGSRTASMKLGRDDARLTLWAGVNKPSATLWASSGTLMPAGLTVGGSGKTGVTVELAGKEEQPVLTMTDNNAKDRIELGVDHDQPTLRLTDSEDHLRVKLSATNGAAYGGFYSQFGSVEIDKNARTFGTPEPLLRIRSAPGNASEVRIGMENAEPSAELMDSAGTMLWSPKPPKSAAPARKKQSKKEPANPL